MKYLRQKLVLLVSIMLLGSAFGLSLSNASVSLLYVVHAKQGTINQKNNNYQLVLHNPRVTYFTDRPVRTAGSMPVEQFMRHWFSGKNSFAQVHPNAALVADFDAMNKMEEHEHFVVLNNPKYDSKQNSLTLDMQNFHGSDRLKQGKFTDVVLFIDNMGCNVSDPSSCW